MSLRYQSREDVTGRLDGEVFPSVRRCLSSGSCGGGVVGVGGEGRAL